MLYSIGPVNFEVEPLSMLGIEESGEADYARKQVVGGAVGHEHMGRGEEKARITARLFPERFGGLGALEALDAMRRSGVGQMMVRGDGKVLGFVLIERITRRSSWLAADGVGRMIDVEIDLIRTTAPSAETAIAQLFSLFG